MPAKPVTIFFILFITFFFSSPITAKEGCDVVPSQYNGPQYYVADPTNQCGLPTPERQNYELKTSSVVCLDNPDLIAKTVNFALQNMIDNSSLSTLFAGKNLIGNSEIKFISYDSFGIKSDKLQDIDPYLTAKLAKAVSLPDYFDASLYDALCVYEGYPDRQQCAQEFQSQLPSDQVNLLASGGWWQFSTTRKDQFEAKKKRAAEIVACADGSNEPLTPCDQPYMVTQKSPWIELMGTTAIAGVNSIDLARKIIDMDYQDFLDEPSAMQMAILSLRESRAYSAVYLVVRNTISHEFFTIKIDNFIDLLAGTGPLYPTPSTPAPPNQTINVDPQSLVVKTSYIPGIHKTTVRAEELYKLVNKKQTGDEGLNDINQRLSTDFGGLDPLDIRSMIARKIGTSNLNCADKVYSYQTSGSQEKYSNILGGSLGVNLNLTIGAINSWTESLRHNVTDVYEAYLIAPTQKMAEVMAQDDNSPLPMMVKKEFQQSAQSDTYIPQQLTDTPPHVENYQDNVEVVQIPCENYEPGPCFEEVTHTYGIEYNAEGNKNIEGPLPGGEATNWMLYLKGKFAWKKGTPEHFSSTCYADELAQKTNSGLLASIGTTLFELLGRTSNENNNNCPDDFTSTTSPSSFGEICGVADEYNIPCCQLEGIMRQESGYGTADYRPGTQSCGSAPEACCNGIGCGPAQITCGQIAGFAGNDNLNVCDPIDSAVLLSRAMLLKLCQAVGECVTYNWEQEKSKAENYSVDDGDYVAAAYFNGLSQGCTLSGCSQFRWGADKSYCDSVESFCTTGDILPSVSDMNFCQDCNTELIRSGVPPMSCP